MGTHERRESRREIELSLKCGAETLKAEAGLASAGGGP
jgi:hypothetical protein